MRTSFFVSYRTLILCVFRANLGFWGTLTATSAEELGTIGGTDSELRRNNWSATSAASLQSMLPRHNPSHRVPKVRAFLGHLVHRARKGVNPVVAVLERIRECLTVFLVGKGVDFRLGCRWVVDVSWRVKRMISFRWECVWVERGRCRCRPRGLTRGGLLNCAGQNVDGASDEGGFSGGANH